MVVLIRTWLLRGLPTFSIRHSDNLFLTLVLLLHDLDEILSDSLLSTSALLVVYVVLNIVGVRLPNESVRVVIYLQSYQSLEAIHDTLDTAYFQFLKAIHQVNL